MSSQPPVTLPTPTRAQRLRAWLTTPAGIATIFIVGFLIRVALMQGHGFPTDMSAFKAWAGRLADRGPWDFYPRGSEEYFVDYPPGYLYVLWVIGVMAKGISNGQVSDVAVKLPAILADLGLAWVVTVGADRLAPVAVARRIPVRAIAASAILLNPAIFFISAVWGQVDSVVTLLLAGGLVLLGTGVPSFRREAAGISLVAVAFGTKPQALFVIPVVVLVLCWRHIAVGAQEAMPELRGVAIRRAVGRVVALGLTGVAAGFVLFAPFRMFPARAFEFYSEASRTYRVTSVFAFNLWGAVGFWRPDSGSDAVEWLGIPVVWWGIALFVLVGSLVLARAWSALRRGAEQGRVLVYGSVALTLVGFAVVTRIHERYLFMPLALAAMLISHRTVRRAVALLSVLYLANVYYPYVYYVDREGLSAPKLWGLYDLYGTDIAGAPFKLLSLVITFACLGIAFLGWRGLETPAPAAPESVPSDEGIPAAVVEREPWHFELHAIGSRGALIALVVFALALLSRVAGLGHPPGMYFDEVYHARTGAEYLTGKEVFEYTHPPLAKEFMGFATQHLSGFGTQDGGPVPRGVDARTIVPRPNGVAWIRNVGARADVQIGTIDGDCRPVTATTLAELDVHGDALTVTKTAAFVAGESSVGPVLIRLDGSTETWRANLPGTASDIAVVSDRAYVVTRTGDLVTVSSQGRPETLAIGAGAVEANSTEAWVTFPGDRLISSFDGERKRTADIKLDAEPTAIAVPRDVERVFLTQGNDIVSFDTETKQRHATIEGAADSLAFVPETTLVWAVRGDAVRAIEPHSGSVIGRTTFSRAPGIVTSEVQSHRLVGVADNHLECAFGRPQFAWRLGSAFTGALMVLFVFLIAMRLFVSRMAALLAAMFLAIDGLAFTVSRIAMNDSYATAFILGAWFCVISAFRARERDARRAVLAWLALGGAMSGLGLASKWPGLYAIAGIGLLLLWDGFVSGERSLWRIAGGYVRSTIVIGLLLGVVPIAIYVATYIPYFQLGHGVTEFLDLQKSMFDYHNNLTATHPFGSPWYGWPFGFRAVFLYLAGEGSARSEIWTIPNLVVSIGGLIGLCALIAAAVKRRNIGLAVVVLGAAVQYLPWIAVSRVTFMYHYLPVVPWLAIALAWLLVEGMRGQRYRTAAIVAVSTAAVAVFVFLYPILVGWEMPVGYLDFVRDVLPWVI